MVHCWNFVPDRRPSFKDLIDWFEHLLQNNTDYLDLNPLLVNNVTYLQPISKGSFFLIMVILTEIRTYVELGMVEK